MCLAIDAALQDWAEDETVALIVIDAEGEKAFSAGGDITELYEAGLRKDYSYGRKFWRDEYRMNARLHDYYKSTGKPVVSFLQGFTMGGGMGVGCHGSHRVVGETSQIAMPECAIGLVPDVGGSMILANAPGDLGTYAGVTGARMAITAQRSDIDKIFSPPALPDILSKLRESKSEFATETLKAILRNAPLSVAATLSIIEQLRGETDIREALALEYRFTYRAQEFGDLQEGIRAAVIDKDRSPKWTHDADTLDDATIQAMLAPLGDAALTF